MASIHPVACLRLQVKFDVEALSRDLEIVKDYQWNAILENKPSLSWKGLALRSFDGRPETLNYSGEDYFDTPLMDILPYMRRVVAFFKCDLRRVRLLALHPGATIGNHVDLPAESALEIRLHLPILTNDAVSFKVDEKEIGMEPGDLWFVDVSRMHSASNSGQSVRVHLVIDCELNDWLRDLLFYRDSDTIMVI